MKNVKWIILRIVLILLFPTVFLSACGLQKSEMAVPVEAAESLMKKLGDGFSKEDPDAVLQLFAEDCNGYDGIGEENGEYISRKDVESFCHSAQWWDMVQSIPETYFVSQDGSFALCQFSTAVEGRGANLQVNLYAIEDGKITFFFNYYGGPLSEGETIPYFRQRTLDPGSSEAKAAVEQADALVQKWRNAFNDRDAVTYMSCYDDAVRHIDIVKTKWRIMTKAELDANITSGFARSTFESKLQASLKSPVPDGFFISADGHYAAVQGSYKDGGMHRKPMLVILEIKDGRIVQQYNYFLAVYSDLLP